VPFSLFELANYRAALERGRDLVRTEFTASFESIESLGASLFETVFQGEVKDSFECALGYAQASGTELLLRLRLADPELALLPWEFLWSKKIRDFLSFHRVSIVRQLEGGTEVLPQRRCGALRILVVSADQVDAPRIDADEEIRQLREALRLPIAARRIVLDDLRKATQSDLAEKLESGGYHIVHFIGHGCFEVGSKKGFLWLYDGKVEDRELAKILSKVRLVFLNCCHGARGDSDDLFADVAQRLYLLGVPSVVAMQCSVQDDVAISFASRFYRRLALGEVLERAMSEARRRLAIKDRRKLEWGIPVLYLRSPGEAIGASCIWPYLVSWIPRLLVAWLLIGFKGASDSYTCPSPPDVYIRFTRIPAGTFVMGSGKDGATPEHEVRISHPLCVSTYEVTQKQWKAVTGRNPSRVKGGNLPVTNVNTEDFEGFAGSLNSQESNAHYRLLTEAQWEYSARGGSPEDFYFEGDSKDLPKYGNCEAKEIGDGYENITSVDSFPPNPFGLYGMYGNASELVADRYSDYDLTIKVDPIGSRYTNIRDRVHRGGSWRHVYWNCNSVHRFYMSEHARSRDDVGIRLARDPISRRGEPELAESRRKG
jgi:formylglycine-generating enzyme required for sulfatase activity